MRIRVVALLCFILPLFLPTANARAQEVESPLFETRASWVATTYRLDWPPFDANASPEVLRSVQQQAIRMILDKHVDLGMNTVVFQVFTHGTAFYDSERIPWSSLITGTPGKDPGWDPLAYAVEQAHIRGLELHAWFNVFQMGNPNTLIDENHVRNTHPEWIKEYPGYGEPRDFWINPADPDAREWLVGNVVEIVENYDVDAIHFDYIRYPSYGFNDDNYSKMGWPNGEPFIDDWRRENINIFVRDVYAAVKDAKPWVKVGSAPIGMYKNDGTLGFWAWNDLYQASRVWLEEGVHDYLAPQLYFDIGSTGSSHHDFRAWLQDWVNNSSGRHIYAGHGTWHEVYGPEKTYKNGEIAQQIDVTREKGAMGQVHFRYTFVNASVLGGKYTSRALPAPMPWLEAAAAPEPPSNASITWDPDARRITVSWESSQGAPADPLRRYAVFRSEGSAPDVTSAADLVAIVGAQDTSYSEVFAQTPDRDVNYAVVAQSHLGIVSGPSDIVSTASTPLDAETPTIPASLRITELYPNPTTNGVQIGFEVGTVDVVRISVHDLLGRTVIVPYEGRLTAGTHQVDVDLGQLAAGVYLIELEGASGRDVRRIVVE